MHVNAKHSFDPEKVPEPKSETASFGLISKFMFGMIKKKLGFDCNESLKGKKILYATGDEGDVEVTPITWE